MSAGAVGLADPRLMALVGSLVAPGTWAAHGKSWGEWCALLGLGVVWAKGKGVTFGDYSSVFDADSGAWFIGGSGAAEASGRLVSLTALGPRGCHQGVCYRQALKGWRKEKVGLDTRRPVSFLLLSRLVDSLGLACSSDYEVVSN